MLETEQAVLLRYERDAVSRRGSGLHIADRFVLTAAHCANGSNLRVVKDGHEVPANVLVRSDDPDIDLALLEVPDLQPIPAMPIARVERRLPTEVRECVALGLPLWKDGAHGPRLAQVMGDIPTAENADPQAVRRRIEPLTLKITNQQVREHPIPKGALDQPGSPWAGMSGAAAVTADGMVLGVVRGHSPAEGMASLTMTSLEAIDDLPREIATEFWRCLGVTGREALIAVPEMIDQTSVRLQRISRLAEAGRLYKEAAIELQVQVVMLEFTGDN